MCTFEQSSQYGFQWFMYSYREKQQKQQYNPNTENNFQGALAKNRYFLKNCFPFRCFSDFIKCLFVFLVLSRFICFGAVSVFPRISTHT